MQMQTNYLNGLCHAGNYIGQSIRPRLSRNPKRVSPVLVYTWSLTEHVNAIEN